MIKPERDTEQCVIFFKQEADLLSKMSHKNIVKVKHLIQLNRVLYMGMDCIQGGRLSNLIADKKTFTDLEASKIMKSIFKAVSYIHEMGIIHRDMKTANILLNDPNDLSSVKIIDFGFGDQKGTALESYDDHVGTLIYMAPEVASKKDYTKSVDIWAVGIIMHLLLAGGKHPFYIKESDTVESFKKKLLSLKKVQPDQNTSWLAQNLFLKLTNIQAHQRYTAKDALKHPWITRKQMDNIPKSFMEKMTNMEYETNLKQKIQLLLFAGLVKEKNDTAFTNEKFQNYKKKILHVSNKINKWHEGLTKTKFEEFQYDKDFVGNMNSPSKFSDSEVEEASSPSISSNSDIETITKTTHKMLS